APDNTINRYQLLGTVAFTLHDAGTDTALSSGEVASFTAYSAFGTSVATAASEADAHRRLMRLLADLIVMRLISTSAAWNGRCSSPAPRLRSSSPGPSPPAPGCSSSVRPQFALLSWCLR